GIALSVPETGAVTAMQGEFAGVADAQNAAPEAARASAELFDRLGSRLGTQRLVRPEAGEAHWPERAWTGKQVGENSREDKTEKGWHGHAYPLARGNAGKVASCSQRPLRLLPRPIPLQAMAIVPDGPPIWFHFNGNEHRVRQAAGPERLMAEWWTGDAGGRDYYRVEDGAGAWFWI